nr:unnamed protein product [Callosobruchus analis]
MHLILVDPSNQNV